MGVVAIYFSGVGMGRDMVIDISGDGACKQYLNSTGISWDVSNIKNKIQDKTESYAGVLSEGQTVFESFGSTEYHDLSGDIYAFGKGYDAFSVVCTYTGTNGGCCAKADCKITTTRQDDFKDPIEMFPDRYKYISHNCYS